MQFHSGLSLKQSWMSLPHSIKTKQNRRYSLTNSFKLGIMRSISQLWD